MNFQGQSKEQTIEEAISQYKTEDLAIAYRPVQALTITLEQFKDEKQVIDNLITIAREAIRDGADVIVPGCVNTSTLLTHNGVADIDGVPIIDGALAAIKLVEVMVDYKRAGLWKSRKTIPKDVMEGLRGKYYYGSESR